MIMQCFQLAAVFGGNNKCDLSILNNGFKFSATAGSEPSNVLIIGGVEIFNVPGGYANVLGSGLKDAIVNLINSIVN